VRVLLTGHLGYLGTMLVPALVAAGHQVTGLDTGLFADCVLGPPPADPPGFAVDLRDVTARHVTGFDAVVHFAALSNDLLGSLAPALTYEINHRASSRLARLARDAGVHRFLYASTCAVYGSHGSAELVDEDAPLRPLTAYAESKARVEDSLWRLVDSDFSPTVLRNATAFGFSPRPRADIVLNNLVGHAVLTGIVKVLSDGTPWRPLVHAGDIAAAVVAVLGAPRDSVHARAFNVGTEANNRTVAEIAGSVAAAVPGAELVITGETGADPRSYRVDFSRLRAAVPDFVARWSIPAGAAELAAAYRGHGLTATAFDQRFTRLVRLVDRRAEGSVGADLRPIPVVVAPNRSGR